MFNTDHNNIKVYVNWLYTKNDTHLKNLDAFYKNHENL
jgi:hypothetical protein